MDTGLDKNEAELGVLVLAVALKVLADGNSLFDRTLVTSGDDVWRGSVSYLLDEHVQVLREIGGKACK